MEVLSYWRSEHSLPLTLASERLQSVALKNDRKAIFAKRLKRFVSIVLKLRRFPSMSLRNVQDIGGCRAIFSSRKKLIQTLRDLKRLPEFRWADGKVRIKDYIQKPKPGGYRSVHIIGLFPSESRQTRRIEVQLRTRIQHYWATALEIVDLFTQQALKSNQGDPEWRELFRELGEHFELMDSIHLFEGMNLAAKRRAYRDRIRDDLIHQQSAKEIRLCCKKLRVMKKFAAYAGSLVVVDEQLSELKQPGFVLLKIDLEGQKVDSTVFAEDNSRSAEAEYTSLEAATANAGGVVVALVSSTAVGGIKEAYPNYFADSSEFVQLLGLILED
ncbi:MAG: RelA/SpoT domain-containing protein [Opitutaceae bacterium]|nr:RelA/SpoT domain-containing protein [Opitutaceae bacterium]